MCECVVRDVTFIEEVCMGGGVCVYVCECVCVGVGGCGCVCVCV